MKTHNIKLVASEHIAARWMQGRSEILGLRRDGEEFPAAASIVRDSPDEEGGGNNSGFAVFLRDLSDERARERALQESQQRFQALFDMSYQFVGMLDCASSDYLGHLSV